MEDRKSLYTVLEKAIEERFKISPGDLMGLPKGVVIYLGIEKDVANITDEIFGGIYASVKFINFKTGKIIRVDITYNGGHIDFRFLTNKSMMLFFRFFSSRFKKLEI